MTFLCPGVYCHQAASSILLQVSSREILKQVKCTSRSPSLHLLPLPPQGFKRSDSWDSQILPSFIVVMPAALLLPGKSLTIIKEGNFCHASSWGVAL